MLSAVRGDAEGRKESLICNERDVAWLWLFLCLMGAVVMAIVAPTRISWMKQAISKLLVRVIIGTKSVRVRLGTDVMIHES